MLVYPSSINLSRWPRLTAGRQALLALAHLRCGDTCAQLAAGFVIGIATACRYIREAIDVLAALAPTLAEAMRVSRTRAFVILDGTGSSPAGDRHCLGEEDLGARIASVARVVTAVPVLELATGVPGVVLLRGRRLPARCGAGRAGGSRWLNFQATRSTWVCTLDPRSRFLRA